MKRYYQENKEKILEQKKWYHQENKEKIRERKKQYRHENKEKIREQKKRSYEKNREKIQKRRERYRQENREELVEYEKQRYQKNREKNLERVKQYYQKNRKKILEHDVQYRQENKERISTRMKRYAKTLSGKMNATKCRHNRRARLMNCKINDLTSDEIKFIKAKTKICSICKRRFTKKLIKSVDHIQSLSKGGFNSLANIQIICYSCNLKKHNKDYTEFTNGQLLMFVGENGNPNVLCSEKKFDEYPKYNKEKILISN